VGVGASDATGNTITLGDGAGDTVYALGATRDTITLGDGAGDTVNASGYASKNVPSIATCWSVC